MNQLIATNQNGNGEIIVSGRELHQFLGSSERYSKWFSRMTTYGFVESVDFTSGQKSTLVNNGALRMLEDHELTIDAAKEISMIQRNEKGKQARRYFIQVEKKWNSPEMIVQRAMEIQKNKIFELETTISKDRRYTDFGKVVAGSDSSINIGSFSKLMYDEHGIRLGRNNMFKWLRENGYLIKFGRERNNPKQQYIEQGLFTTTVTIVSRTHGDVQSLTTLVTGKGQIKLSEKLINEFKVKVVI